MNPVPPDCRMHFLDYIMFMISSQSWRPLSVSRSALPYHFSTTLQTTMKGEQKVAYYILTTLALVCAVWKIHWFTDCRVWPVPFLLFLHFSVLKRPTLGANRGNLFNVHFKEVYGLFGEKWWLLRYNRENLEKAVKVYKQICEDSAMRLTLVEANCGLAHLCIKMGEWKEAKEYLKEAEDLIGKEKKITVCQK